MEKNLFYSVLVCCYNSEKYISETIDSIINQTYKHWEIVIVNDGSTDSTENIIFNYINQNIPITYYTNKLIKYKVLQLLEIKA